jgi:hypothetical protein
MTWIDLDSRETDPQRLAVNQALACFFVLYLNQQNKLVDVYKALQAVDVTDSGTAARTQTLEAALGRPLADAASDFKTWLQGRLGSSRPLRWAQ